ncbi:MAG: adenylate kinase [Clostridia bacterium]|nr:adenylate kinase [Clostridia bacterium]
MKLILLGAPGAGKGTQAENICKKYNIPAISTGDIIRKAMKDGTPMGEKVKSYMEKGALVPDEIVIEIISGRLLEEDCKNGFILDGFPRTVPQAQALDKMGVEIDKVISIEVSDENIIERMSGRRICNKCGTSYHLVYKPSVNETDCKKCDGKLIIRDDDKPETVKERLHIYHQQTEPLKDYYGKTGKLRLVEGQEKVEDTTALTMKALED